MIDDFLRPAGSRAEMAADAVRVVGTLSVVLALVVHGLTDAAIVAFATPGLMLPRFIGMRAGADIAVSATLLVAAWSNVYELYTSIWWWDLPVHLVCAGVLAGTAYLFLGRRGIVALPSTTGFSPGGAVVLTTAFGLALGAVWEMIEWFGHAYITDEIYVTLDDTVGDMVAGGVGALLVGVVMTVVPLLREPIGPSGTGDRSVPGRREDLRH